jgi:CheY-like chemotaxis protein
MMNARYETLLLVEDNLDDVFFLQRALEKANIQAPVRMVRTGQAAIDYLKLVAECGERAPHPLPSLVLLDLKIPYVSGFEVLKWIREQPALANLAVVILTSSPEQRDRERAAALGASGYLVKPPTELMMRQLLGSEEIAPGPLVQSADQFIPVVAAK